MLLEGVDLSAKVAGYLKKDSRLLQKASEDILDTLVDDVILGICFDLHRAVKTGLYEAMDCDDNNAPHPIAGHVDVFGLPVSTLTGLPSLKTVPQIECPNCKRQLAASRFAPHLEKCMGMGRNSSRLASRRIATSNKDSYRDVEEEETGEGGADGDEDWIEPGKISNRRKRDKNSPKRNKPLKFKGNGDNGEGLITPPSSYDQLSLDERRQLLNQVCGVPGYHGKICMRSIKCPTHTDSQRREVRLKWLSNTEDMSMDMDTLSEGDTAALRESLAQLSNASSPAESTISTSSNPSEQEGKSQSVAKRVGQEARQEVAEALHLP